MLSKPMLGCRWHTTAQDQNTRPRSGLAARLGSCESFIPPSAPPDIAGAERPDSGRASASQRHSRAPVQPTGSSPRVGPPHKQVVAISGDLLGHSVPGRVAHDGDEHELGAVPSLRRHLSRPAHRLRRLPLQPPRRFVSVAGPTPGSVALGEGAVRSRPASRLARPTQRLPAAGSKARADVPLANCR